VADNEALAQAVELANAAVANASPQASWRVRANAELEKRVGLFSSKELPDLCAKALINAPDYKGSRWGLLVVDAETGKPVYAPNPDMLFAPASVTKLYSCAAALVELGPDAQSKIYEKSSIDLAMRDADGLWYMLGRSDDTLKIAGKRTGPAEIESVLVESGLVAEAAVVGLPDQITGSALAETSMAFAFMRTLLIFSIRMSGKSIR
jgi:D-alanyl-D-alanine carboxypeptidase